MKAVSEDNAGVLLSSWNELKCFHLPEAEQKEGHFSITGRVHIRTDVFNSSEKIRF